MKGDLYCIGGRIFRYDPQFDDPDLMTDVGQCPDCSGDGCGDEPDEMVHKLGRSQAWLSDPDQERQRAVDKADAALATTQKREAS